MAGFCRRGDRNRVGCASLIRDADRKNLADQPEGSSPAEFRITGEIFPAGGRSPRESFVGDLSSGNAQQGGKRSRNFRMASRKIEQKLGGKSPPIRHLP
jgi:hypothetical protein